MPTFSIEECLRFGWETFKKRPGILIVALALVWLIPSVPSLFFPAPEVTPGVPPPPPTAGEGVAALISIFLSIMVSLGAVTFALRAHDDIASVKLGDLWNPQPFWRYLGATILTWLIVTVGFLLLIVPGVIAALGLYFASYFVIDRGAGPIDALKQSWHMTKGHKWQLFLFSLVLVGLNLLGLLALVIGIFVTVPITWLAITHAYRTLASQAGA